MCVFFFIPESLQIMTNPDDLFWVYCFMDFFKKNGPLLVDIIKKKVGRSLMKRLQQNFRCVSCFISFRKKRPITIQHVNITVTSSVYFWKMYLKIPQKEMISKTMFGVCTWSSSSWINPKCFWKDNVWLIVWMICLININAALPCKYWSNNLVHQSLAVSV